MNLIFTRKVGALHMDDTATGWPTGDTTVELSWDSTSRKLYAVNIHNGVATKGLQCVAKINPQYFGTLRVLSSLSGRCREFAGLPLSGRYLWLYRSDGIVDGSIRA